MSGEFISAWLHNRLSKTAEGSKLWQNSEGTDEGRFSVTMEPNQKLELCFSGLWDDAKAEEEDKEVPESVRVGFNIRVHPIPRTLPEGEKGPDLEKALRITERAVSIETAWNDLTDHFEFLRSREVVHLKLSSAILDRLMWWTILEACVMVTMAVCQVLYWRKFFEQRRYL